MPTSKVPLDLTECADFEQLVNILAGIVGKVHSVCYFDEDADRIRIHGDQDLAAAKEYLSHLDLLVEHDPLPVEVAKQCASTKEDDEADSDEEENEDEDEDEDDMDEDMDEDEDEDEDEEEDEEDEEEDDEEEDEEEDDDDEDEDEEEEDEEDEEEDVDQRKADEYAERHVLHTALTEATRALLNKDTQILAKDKEIAAKDEELAALRREQERHLRILADQAEKIQQLEAALESLSQNGPFDKPSSHSSHPLAEDFGAAATAVQKVWRGRRLRRRGPLQDMRRLRDIMREALAIETPTADDNDLCKWSTSRLAGVTDSLERVLLRLDDVSGDLEDMVRAHRGVLVRQVQALLHLVDTQATRLSALRGDTISQLTRMGFDERAAQDALNASDWSLEQAVDRLILTAAQ